MQSDSQWRCPVCLASGAPDILTATENMFGSGETFHYAVCRHCGSLALQDVPDDLGRYYPQEYYSIELDPEHALGRPGVRQLATAIVRSVVWGRGAIAKTAVTASRRRQLRTLVSILQAIRRAGLPRGRETRVLDVGCGSGMLAFALGLGGVRNVTGVDPFVAADRELSSGPRLVRSDLSSLDGDYDLIMFHHSFEHVVDVEAELRYVTKRLAGGGRVLVRMPTPSSHAFETYAANWVQLDAPRHLTLLSRDGMELLCERVGLRVASVQDDSTGFQFWGSEESKADIALSDPSSVMVTPKNSAFSAQQLAGWEREAVRLNRMHGGDQAAWVLERTTG